MQSRLKVVSLYQIKQTKAIMKVSANDYITATDKRNIKAIINANLTEGQINRKAYKISKDFSMCGYTHKVIILEKRKNDFGKTFIDKTSRFISIS